MKKIMQSALALAAVVVAGTFASCTNQDNAIVPEPVLPTLNVESTTPADGGVWEKANIYASTLNVEFQVTFDEEVSLVSEVVDGIEFVNEAGETAAEGTWRATVDSEAPQTVVLSLRSSDDWQVTVRPADQAYTLTIPAGVILSAANEAVKNAEITLTFYDSEKAQQEASIAKIVATTPADLEVLPADGTVTLSFRDEVEVAQAAPAVKVEKADGTAVSATWAAAQADAKTIVLTPSGFAIEDVAYVITIPAGLAKDAKGNLSVETTVKVYGTAAAQDAAKIKVVSAADIAVTEGKAEAKFVVTLSHEVSKNNSYPTFAIYKNADKTGGDLSYTDGWDYSWSYLVNGAELTIRQSDWSYSNFYKFDAEAGASYYVVIPANTVKTADGILNDELVVEVKAVAAN